MLAKPKVTAAKILLARGRSHKKIKKKLRVSLSTISSIATGTFYCGPKGSYAYYPTEAKIREYREEFHAMGGMPPAPKPMAKEDICNVGPVTDAELLEALGQLVGADRASDIADYVLDQRVTVVAE